jgi:hypothetical protein
MGSIPFIGKADETMQAGGVPARGQSRRRLRWSLAGTSTIKNENASKSFHLSPGVNEPYKRGVKKQFFPFSSRGGGCCWEQQYPDPLDGSGVSQRADITLWRTFIPSANVQSQSTASSPRHCRDQASSVLFLNSRRAFKKLGGDLSSDLIDEATAAHPDYLLALEALSSAVDSSQLIADDPFIAARFRGFKRKKQMLETAGGTLTSEQVAEGLGISRQAVDKRRLFDQLLAFDSRKTRLKLSKLSIRRRKDSSWS